MIGRVLQKTARTAEKKEVEEEYDGNRLHALRVCRPPDDELWHGGAVFVWSDRFDYRSHSVSIICMDMYVLRLLVCLTIPVTNLLMYFATIGGDAREFDFQPMPLAYNLVFILEIIIIFLPEIFLLIERKREIKGVKWMYAGMIVCVSILFWCTI
ncbi:hypothetical protein [Bacillus sp. ms-22]|uniref:hypothetical protein n=1 Tax=Bacillus sp. ms-22 TaxID=2683680 RepID=UPI001E557E3A|nr:hypothetical protein [Bacillus sp. ms-22]